MTELSHSGERSGSGLLGSQGKINGEGREGKEEEEEGKEGGIRGGRCKEGRRKGWSEGKEKKCTALY